MGSLHHKVAVLVPDEKLLVLIFDGQLFFKTKRDIFYQWPVLPPSRWWLPIGIWWWSSVSQRPWVWFQLTPNCFIIRFTNFLVCTSSKKKKMEEKLTLAALPVPKRGLNKNRLWQIIPIKQDNIAAQRDRMFSTRLWWKQINRGA